MEVWHWAQVTRLALCAPVSAIGVVGRLNVAPSHPATSPWHCVQVTEKFPAT